MDYITFGHLDVNTVLLFIYYKRGFYNYFTIRVNNKLSYIVLKGQQELFLKKNTNQYIIM